MRTMPVLCVALLLTGCGLKKDVERLEAVVAERDVTIAARDASIASLEQTRDDLESQIVDLQARIDDLEADLQAMEADLDAERDKSARMLADRGALRDEVVAMKQALAELELRKRQADERVAAYRDLVSRFQALIDAGTLSVKIVDGRMVVVLATDVLFASGSAELSADGAAALTQVGEVLATLSGRRFQVEGHTDDVPIRTAQYPSNWYLAAARAIGVVRHLMEHGVAPEAVSAASFADTRPVASNADRDARALNRRIEIVVVPDLSDLPGYDELKAMP